MQKHPGLKVSTAKAGINIDLDSALKVSLLAPNSDTYEEINNYLAVIKLTYKKTSFIFTGDAESIRKVRLMRNEKEKLFDGKKAGENLQGLANKVAKITKDIANKSKDLAENSRDSVINVIDQNSNGEIDIEDIIILGLKVPGIKINRAEFLKRELYKNYPQKVIDAAIANTPAQANIPLTEINKIADEVIKFERNCVSGISAALSTPGGVAMVATIPADVAQYYGYMLRATQKLLYLYGFPEIDTEQKGQKFDSETINILILCLGVMYGVAGANNAIKAMAKALAKGVEKKLIKAALNKGAIYPIVKSVMKWFNVNLTKKIFAQTFKKAIPVVGGIISGSITFVTFKPCCDKLKASLQDTLLSNPNHNISDEEITIIIEDTQEV